ncbi:MAG: ATP-binding protein [Kofleriaceae bacterium]
MTDREVIDSLSTGVLIANDDEAVSHANPAACRMLRRARLECVGQPVPLVLGLSASLREHGLDHGSAERRFVLSLPTGPAGVTARTVGDRGFVCLFRSSDAGRGADALLVEHEREAALGAILAAFAHEVRNPLAALTAAVELLRDVVDSAGDAHLGIIERQLRRLTNLARAPIALGQLSSTQRVACVVDQLVADAVAVVALEATRGRVELRIVGAPAALPRVVVGEREVVDALAELLDNAVAASPPGAAVEVSTAPTEDRRRVAIEIADAGPGMDHAQIGEALRAFSTTRAGATGSGLALAHRFIRDCGGRLALESPGGAGMVARVELPIEEGP